MDQMIRLDVPSIGKEYYGRIQGGFMREWNGKIYFLLAWGKYTIHYPVLKDGTIFTCGDTMAPDEVIELVHPKDLGISEIRWSI